MKKLLLLWLALASCITLAACGGGNGEYTPTNPTENYQAYTDTGVATALENGDNVVLYFGATRCPTCVSLMKDIESSINQIPDGVTIFTADYDKAKNLKEQYEVTAKHTTIYLTPEGEVARKNTGKENSLQDIIDEIETL